MHLFKVSVNDVDGQENSRSRPDGSHEISENGQKSDTDASGGGSYGDVALQDRNLEIREEKEVPWICLCIRLGPCLGL